MNKKILSTSLSLACHTVFLIIALNLILTPQSISEPVAPPILIHVHLDSRPFSPSMGAMGVQVPQANKPMAPPMMRRMKPVLRKETKPSQSLNRTTPVPYRKPAVSNDHVVSVVKKNVPATRTPAEHKVEKSISSSKEIFKNMAVANHSLAASALPVTDVSEQMQNAQVKPSMESELQNFQGVSPYLPFDQNGSGTDIKAFLGYDLYTYEDPDDHMKYFRLSIRVEDMPGGLAVLPKEINFIIDASGSIGDDMLNKFKEGVGDSLRQLGPDDKFNVTVFNDVVHKMEEAAVPNNVADIKEADDFMDNFRSIATTDLFDTVLKSVNTPHAIKPAYLFLLSDGQPTQGVTDSLQLINKIGEADQGRVPIFGVAAGAYYNEYLMNFLTFTNHGWAGFAPMNIVNGINDMYDQIKDPVLINLRYYETGLNRQEIYPKALPDLFKGSEFVLYGQYTNEGDFLVQLNGDSQYDVKQYVIKDNLNNARQGDRSIAQEWAMRKIFYLIGKLEYDQDNQDIIDQINQLAAKFDLKIPKYTNK